MPSQIDKDFLDYIEFVRRIWVVGSFPRTFADDLIPAMYDAGFMIDNVYSSFSSSDYVKWFGKCYDEDMIIYTFMARWTFNMNKFTPNSELHYFDLTDLEIEPYGGSQ